MSAILAVDPGKCTGYFADLPEPDLPELSQRVALQFCEDAVMWARKYGDQLTIVYEKFTITAQTLRKAREYHAIEVIGVLKYAAFLHGCRLVEQTPGDAKKFATDARLRKVGLWVPGKDHARDAARHWLLFNVREGLINPEVLSGPDA